MDRTIPFEAEGVCDVCNAKGAYDFMGDTVCKECLEELSKDVYEDARAEFDLAVVDLADKEVKTPAELTDLVDAIYTYVDGLEDRLKAYEQASTELDKYKPKYDKVLDKLKDVEGGIELLTVIVKDHIEALEKLRESHDNALSILTEDHDKQLNEAIDMAREEDTYGHAIYLKSVIIKKVKGNV